MIQLFFKTRDQMGPMAQALTLPQESNLRNLIEALCADDRGCNTSKIASGFTQDLDTHEARMVMEQHRLPGLFTEVYLSFPIGGGSTGMLKLFRWREKKGTRFGVGTSNQEEFSIKQIAGEKLQKAARSLFNGIKPAVR